MKRVSTSEEAWKRLKTAITLAAEILEDYGYPRESEKLIEALEDVEDEGNAPEE